MSETLPEKQSSASFSLVSLNPFAQLSTIFQFSQLRWLLLSYLVLVMMPFALVPNLPILSRDLFGWTPAQVAPLFAIFGLVNLLDQLILLRGTTTRLEQTSVFIAQIA